MQKVQLRQLAYVRSGDKGDICNIGLLALNAENYEVIRREVTPERVKAFYGDMVKGPVKIYELPNIHALEIVLHNALDGGATRTLRFDQTGKAMGTALLRMEVAVE
ncbi:MAG: hypothetical protein HYR94_08125 [Chloroflexi bacterium]|nr:hypothetical protein [Chloroflexota bacterium]